MVAQFEVKLLFLYHLCHQFCFLPLIHSRIPCYNKIDSFFIFKPRYFFVCLYICLILFSFPNLVHLFACTFVCFLFIFFNLFIYFFIYLFIYIFIHLFIYLFFHLSFLRGVFAGEGSETFSISFNPQNLLRSSHRAVLVLKNVPRGLK